MNLRTLVLPLLLAAMPAAAAFSPIPDRAAFDAAYPGATFEDFEEANVASSASEVFSGVLDASTNNGVFSAGDIVGGLRISVGGNGSPEGNLFVSGPGFANYTSHAISYNSPSTTPPEMSVEFLDGGVLAFAIDLTSNPDGNDIAIGLFSGDLLLDSFTVTNVLGAGTFLGGASSTDAITRVTLAGVNGNDYFGVDNIAFSPVPEPSSLVLVGLGAMLANRRR